MGRNGKEKRVTDGRREGENIIDRRTQEKKD
jgi:hypothetical protein